jgi:hypothetical protein
LLFALFNISLSAINFFRNLKICKGKPQNSATKYTEEQNIVTKQSEQAKRASNQEFTKFEKESFIEEFDQDLPVKRT